MSFFPGFHWETAKGPVLEILPPSRLAMALRAKLSSAGRLGAGKSRSMTTASPSENTFQAGFVLRNEAATASGVTGAPSWKVTPRRKKNSQRWSPDSACQEVANAGSGSPCASNETRLSNIRLDRLRYPDQSG